MSQAEFDEYAESYDELLKDPLRDGFGGGGSDFFHCRRRDLIRGYFRSQRIDTTKMDFLDLGCGKGELLELLREDFHRSAGCDPSTKMLGSATSAETRPQTDPEKIPFDDAEFDVMTAAGVFHHVPPGERLPLAQEVFRVLKPGGFFIVMEHNPYNPVTRAIVSHTPVDANAILLRRREAGKLLEAAGMTISSARYFLFFPGAAYRLLGDKVEAWLGDIPFGGQFVVVGRKAS